MGSGNLVGALALVTLVIVVGYAIVHFGGFLKKPENRERAHNALVRDGKSATAEAREGGDHPAHEGRTLKERLDDSDASSHPTTPKESQTRS